MINNLRNHTIVTESIKCFRCENPTMRFYTADTDVKSTSKKAINGYITKSVYFYHCPHCNAQTEIVASAEASHQHLRDLQKYYDDVRYSKLSAEEKRLHDLSKSL